MTGQSGGILDQVVRQILLWLDVRHVALASALAVPVLCWVRYKRTKQRATLQEMLNAALGLLMICSGVTAGLVLIFTRPLAVDLLSSDTATLAGLATLFASIALGWKNLRSVVMPERPVSLEVNATDEAPDSTVGQ